MKIILILIFSVLTTVSFGQTDDYIVVAAVASVHKAERDLLDEIELNQEKILIPTTLLAYSTAELIFVEQKLHRAYEKVQVIVDNAQVFLQIIEFSKDIIELQDMTYEIAKDRPELMLLAGKAEIDLIKEATAIMTNLLMVTKESKFNLMNNKQRLDVMQKVLHDLSDLKETAFFIYKLVESSIYTNGLDFIIQNTLNLHVEYNEIYKSLKREYDIIFK